MKDAVDQSVDDATALLIALLRDDVNIVQDSWRFHEDLMEVVLPLLSMAQVMAKGLAHVDPTKTAEGVLESCTLALAAEPSEIDEPNLDAMRDGAALALAWFRSDMESVERLIAPYQSSETQSLLVAGVANVVIQVLRVIDHRLDVLERIVRSSGETVRREMKKAMIQGLASEGGACDVCNDENVTWRYPCRDFTTPQGQTSEGSWDVCDKCHELVEAGDVAEMTRLGTAPLLKAAAKLNKTQRAKFYEMVGSFQRQFMASRTGPGQRLQG